MRHYKFSILTLLAGLIAGLLIAGSFPGSQWASEGDIGQIGRYQISSWGAYSGAEVSHSGYYIVDTTTGRVVDRGNEIHGIEQGSATAK